MSDEQAVAADKAFSEAQHEAGFYGLSAIVLVVGADGAYTVRCGGMNINTAVGVLFRAASAVAAAKDNSFKVVSSPPGIATTGPLAVFGGAGGMPVPPVLGPVPGGGFKP